MKKITINIVLVSIFSLLVFTSFSQTANYNIRVIENAMGYLEVQMKETTGGTNLPSNTDGDLISDVTFAIKWTTGTDADLSFLCSGNDYNIHDPAEDVGPPGAGLLTDVSGWKYRYYNANSTPYATPVDWVIDEWETIVTFVVTGTTGTESFYVAETPFGISTRNFIISEVGGPPNYQQYSPALDGSVSNYSFPTIVYDYVWIGGGAPGFGTNGNSWSNSANWQSECEGAIGAAPTSSNNCFIPAGASDYPTNIYSSSGGPTGTANHVRIELGATVDIGNSSLTNQFLEVSGNLHIYGILDIKNDGSITVSGDTYLDAAECLVVEATTDGVGSFIDNGTITYGGSGTAKVQTYLTGSGGAGTFDLHLVGPTVDYGSGGALLSTFNLVNNETYAYEYDEAGNAWQNISSLTTLIPTTKGIGLSTNDGSTNTMEMTGALMTGDLSSASMTFGGGGNILLSNPYPSSIFWDDLEANNTGNVNDKVYVYDGSAYQDYNTVSGGTNGFTGYLQVGQAFFVEAIANATFDFDNGDRHHSNEVFYAPVALMTNRLDVRVEGNNMNDGLLVHFYEGAIEGYDANEDIEKMMSYNENSTQIWTDLNEGLDMSINAMPEELLQGDMFSVPLSFACGTTTDYTLTFKDIESFEYGTEIYLEDTKTNEEWVYLNDNPIYTFTAAEYQSPDRFILHFFGPTDIEELDAETVEIYSAGQYAYVRNNTQENIKMIYVYNLASELVMSTKDANHQKFSKFWVSDHVGYYIVKVVTDTNIYTEKVLIFK